MREKCFAKQYNSVNTTSGSSPLKDGPPCHPQQLHKDKVNLQNSGSVIYTDWHKFSKTVEIHIEM